MALLDYLLRRHNKTASVAKERLQIILAREHATDSGPDYLPELKKDILAVVGKYVDIDLERVQVSLDSSENCDILELNISLPDVEAQPAIKQKQAEAV